MVWAAAVMGTANQESLVDSRMVELKVGIKEELFCYAGQWRQDIVSEVSDFRKVLLGLLKIWF
jgi:hypothetical protein